MGESFTLRPGKKFLGGIKPPSDVPPPPPPKPQGLPAPKR